MKATMNEHGTTLGTAGAGILATLGSLGVSMLSDVEQWLRVGSLAVGMAVGIATLWKITRKP
jgi:hypothetical protein